MTHSYFGKTKQDFLDLNKFSSCLHQEINQIESISSFES